MTVQQDEKPLEPMPREALIEEVQQGCVAVGAYQAESECRDTCITQLEHELGLADVEIHSTRLQRDDALETIAGAARDYDAEIERWKQRVRQEIAAKCRVHEVLTQVSNERDALQEAKVLQEAAIAELQALNAHLHNEHAALQEHTTTLCRWMEDFAKTIPGVGEALERLLFWSTLGRAYREQGDNAHND